MWFLREDPEEVSKQLDDNLTVGLSLDFLERVAIQMKQMLDPSGVAVVVIGDVARANNSIISLARELVRRLHQQKLFRYIGYISDHLHTQKKTTRIWKETKGQATAIDRILILSDISPKFRADRLGEELLGVASHFLIDAEQLAEHAHSFAGL